MHRTYSALVLDDDPQACNFLHWYLDKNFPWIRVASANRATAVKGFDIYLIDNDFDGKHRAVDLVRNIRASEPDALILVFSAMLTPTVFKGLINAGCDGACEKGNSADISVLHRQIQDYVDQRAKADAPKKTGVRGTVDAISEMLDRWNSTFISQSKTAGASA